MQFEKTWKSIPLSIGGGTGANSFVPNSHILGSAPSPSLRFHFLTSGTGSRSRKLPASNLDKRHRWHFRHFLKTEIWSRKVVSSERFVWEHTNTRTENLETFYMWSTYWLSDFGMYGLGVLSDFVLRFFKLTHKGF